MLPITRFFQKPLGSYFLFGPRGTGKSTFTHQQYHNAIWIDLLLPDVLRNYLAYPERLQQAVAAQPDSSIVVIDEIQKAPALLDVVHHMIEKDKKRNFVLTGSSPRKLKNTGVDLLGGRASRKILHPFMAGELGTQFSLENALNNGLLPLVLGSISPRETLQAYINLYLREEVQMEGLVRSLESFSRFLEVISFSHGSLINLTNIARECDVKRKTVENYLSILEDLLLAFRLPVFTKRAQRQLVAHPKIYLFDAGVFQTLRPRGPLDRSEEIQGAALEGLVAQHLRAWNDYSEEQHSISFWRTRAGVEVDFVVYGENNFYAIEVKNSRQVHPADVKPLQSFLEDYPMAKAILLYRGTERLKIQDVLCIPCDEFLLQLKPNQALYEASNVFIG
jgi:predicted AAA+ superfamily ATPase